MSSRRRRSPSGSKKSAKKKSAERERASRQPRVSFSKGNKAKADRLCDLWREVLDARSALAARAARREYVADAAAARRELALLYFALAHHERQARGLSALENVVRRWRQERLARARRQVADLLEVVRLAQDDPSVAAIVGETEEQVARQLRVEVTKLHDTIHDDSIQLAVKLGGTAKPALRVLRSLGVTSSERTAARDLAQYAKRIRDQRQAAQTAIKRGRRPIVIVNDKDDC